MMRGFDRRGASDFAAKILATGLGLGYSPWAPGTAGSAVGIGVVLLLPNDLLWQGGAALLLSVIGLWSATVLAKELNDSDPSCVVIDEVAGMLLTCLALPHTPAALCAAFLLFRVLDVIKGPLRRLEDLPGGWGIMADDVAAGLIGRLILLYWWPWA